MIYMKMFNIRNIIIAMKSLITRISNRMNTGREQIIKLEIRLQYFDLKPQEQIRKNKL